MDTPSLPEYSGSLLLDGQSYDVPLPNETHYRTLAAWLEDRALARVESRRGTIPEDVWQQRYEATIRAVSAEAFAPGQPAFDIAMSALETREQLLLIVLRSKYPDVPAAAVRGLFREIVQTAIAGALKQARQQP